MAMKMQTIPVALAAVLFAGAAFAQTPGGAPDRIVLEAKSGSVMASSGGEYQTAAVGRTLNAGDSVMLGERSSATVTYYYTNANGEVVRKCSERYAGANTYVIDNSCVAAGWVSGARAGGAPWIIGAALVGAAIINGMDDAPVGPLSTGPNGSIRHF